MLGSRSFYAKLNDTVFEFQDKAFRDWYVTHTDATIILAKYVYRDFHCKTVKISYYTFKKFKEFMGNAYK